MLGIALLLLMHQAPEKPRTAALRLVEVRWSFEDSGFRSGKPCDPPLSKEESASGILCMEEVKTWRAYCDDPRTVDILPRIEKWFDGDKAHAAGDKYWCVLAVETK